MTFLFSTSDFICLTFLLHSQPQLSNPKLGCIQFSPQKLQVLTPVHNDTEDTDDAGNYNSVIGIALMKAFSCAKNGLANFISLAGESVL